MEARGMRINKKPDLLATLAIIVCIGVIASSLTQGVFARSPETHAAQLISANPILQSASPVASPRP